jgi:hypothetical protein
MANVSLMTKRLKRRCGIGCDDSQKTSISIAAGSGALVKEWDKRINVDEGYVEK